MSRHQQALLGLAAATPAVSVSAVLVAEAGTDAATVVWLRMALAVGLLAPWALPQLRRGAVGATARDAALTVGAGLLLAIHFLAWTASLADTSVAASVLLVSLHPLIVIPLGARFQGDRIGGAVVVGTVLALGGTALTCAGSLGGAANSLRGDLLAVAGGIALAGYLLIGRARRHRGGVAGYSAVVYAIVSLAAAGLAAARPGWHAPDGRALLACAGLALVCTVGGHTVFNWTLRRLPAGTVSLSFLCEAPLAALLALVVLGQHPPLSTLVGGVLILSGLAAALRGSSSTRFPAVAAP